MAWETAGSILSDAAVDLGLGELADAFGSSDAAVVQLRRRLKQVGRGLCRIHAWSQLTKEHSFETEEGEGRYDLPADFGWLLGQTGWDRTGTAPLGGPLSAQAWQHLRASVGPHTFGLTFRPLQGQLWLADEDNVPAGSTLAFEYQSTYWVQSTLASEPNASAPSANSDVLLFDAELLALGTRALWLRGKGFDSAAAEEEYQNQLRLCIAHDTPASVLSMAPGGGPRLIDHSNLPLTGWGGGVAVGGGEEAPED